MKKCFIWRSGKIFQIICMSALMMMVFVGCGGNIDSQTEQANSWTDLSTGSIGETATIETEEDLNESVGIIGATCFDLRVLKTNWTEEDWETPVLLSTYEEYECYMQNVLAGCEWEADYQKTHDVEFLKNYQKEWFDANGLLMLPLKHSDWSYVHEVELALSDEGGKLQIDVLATCPEEKSYPIESFWLIVLELKKADIDAVKEMSVSITEAIDETQIVLKTKTHILKHALVLESDNNASKENVFTIRNSAELNEFYNQIQFANEDMVNELRSLVGNYQEAWFADNLLIFIRMTAPATGYDYDLRLVWDTETNKIKMELFEHHGGILYYAPGSYIFVVEVSKSDKADLNKFAGYEACRIFSGYN